MWALPFVKAKSQAPPFGVRAGRRRLNRFISSHPAREQVEQIVIVPARLLLLSAHAPVGGGVSFEQISAIRRQGGVLQWRWLLATTPVRLKGGVEVVFNCESLRDQPPARRSKAPSASLQLTVRARVVRGRCRSVGDRKRGSSLDRGGRRRRPSLGRRTGRRGLAGEHRRRPLWGEARILTEPVTVARFDVGPPGGRLEHRRRDSHEEPERRREREHEAMRGSEQRAGRRPGAEGTARGVLDLDPHSRHPAARDRPRPPSDGARPQRVFVEREELALHGPRHRR